MTLYTSAKSSKILQENAGKGVVKHRTQGPFFFLSTFNETPDHPSPILTQSWLHRIITLQGRAFNYPLIYQTLPGGTNKFHHLSLRERRDQGCVKQTTKVFNIQWLLITRRISWLVGRQMWMTFSQVMDLVSSVVRGIMNGNYKIFEKEEYSFQEQLNFSTLYKCTLFIECTVERNLLALTHQAQSISNKNLPLVEKPHPFSTKQINFFRIMDSNRELPY